jgi:hypothetical protein
MRADRTYSPETASDDVMHNQGVQFGGFSGVNKDNQFAEVATIPRELFRGTRFDVTPKNDVSEDDPSSPDFSAFLDLED